jgi:hypothetical protein
MPQTESITPRTLRVPRLTLRDAGDTGIVRTSALRSGRLTVAGSVRARLDGSWNALRRNGLGTTEIELAAIRAEVTRYAAFSSGLSSIANMGRDCSSNIR